MMTDEMLRQAAGESVECFMKSITSDYDPSRTFIPSPRFQRKISKLTRRANHPYAYRTWYRVATILLTALLAGAVWLAADPEARAAFVSWVRVMYEGSVAYEFFGQRNREPLSEFEFASLPEGFVETDFIDDKYMHTRIYENNGEGLLLSYMIMSDQSAKGLFSEGFRYESVQIGSCQGDFYEMEKSDDTNELIWFDEEKRIIFQISAFMAKDEMVKLAESVIKK